jgi:hypothetical protein
LNESWTMVSAVSSAISALVVLAAAGYAAMQVSELRKARGIQSLLSIHERYQSPSLNRIRRRLHAGQLDDVGRLTEVEGEQLGDLLNQLELISVLVEHSLIDHELVWQLFPTIPKTVKQAMPFIQVRRQSNARYALFSEKLAQSYQQ